jgi:hypothetical protein
MSGIDLQEAFRRLQVPADVLCPGGMLWKHRQDGATDIYFLSNQQGHERTESVSFRVADRAPELWWPDTGRVEAVPFEVKDGRTVVSLHFDPAGSVFVVFRKAKSDAPLRKWEPGKTIEVNGPWEVQFPTQRLGLDKLVSWTDRKEAAIKYHSGVATYRKTIELPLAEPGKPAAAAILDLGAVHAIARVRVNGQEVATLWKPPYTVDITAAARPGENKLEVEVVNTWLNRLVGDQQGGAKPVTFTTMKAWNAGTRLQPAGLLGPVAVRLGAWADEKR